MSTSQTVSSARNEVRAVVPRLIEFYAGWPSAMSAAKIAKQVFEETKP